MLLQRLFNQIAVYLCHVVDATYLSKQRIGHLPL